MPASQGGGFLSANFCMVVCSVGMGVVPVVSVSVSSLQARVQWGACHACVHLGIVCTYHSCRLVLPRRACLQISVGGVIPRLLLIRGGGLSFSPRAVGDFLFALLSITGWDPRLVSCVIVSLEFFFLLSPTVSQATVSHMCLQRFAGIIMTIGRNSLW